MKKSNLLLKSALTLTMLAFILETVITVPSWAMDKEELDKSEQLAKGVTKSSLKERDWETTHITQKTNEEECPEFDLFIQTVKENPQLPVKNLIISNIRKIFPEELKVLREWLSKNNTLKSLSLIRCGLTGQEYPNKEEYLFIKELKTWLEANENVEELDLSGNPLKYSTAYITEALQKNKSLKKLILNNVYPNPDMFSETFTEDLAQNKTLEFLSFRDNKVGFLKPEKDIIYFEREGLPPITIDYTGTLF